MSTVFVTGGSGFVGSHLVKRLAAEHRVKCLVRPATLMRLSDELRSLENVEWISGDLSDQATLREALHDVEQVYHVAGLTKAVTASEFKSVNEEGTRSVLEACDASPSAKRVVMISSLAAAGPSHDGVPLIESRVARPVSQYGRSKLAAEQVAREFGDRLTITIIRPPIVLGPGDRDGFEMFRAIHRSGMHLVAGLHDYRVSLIHVSDLALAIIRLAACGDPITTRDEPGQGIYYVAIDQMPTYAELGKEVGFALGMEKTRVIHAPYAAVYAIAGVSSMISWVTKRPSILNVDKIREAQAGHWVCSAAKWKGTSGDAPRLVLSDLLKQTAQWYFDHGWLK